VIAALTLKHKVLSNSSHLWLETHREKAEMAVNGKPRQGVGSRLREVLATAAVQSQFFYPKTLHCKVLLI
jgi:hypothetical protein